MITCFRQERLRFEMHQLWIISDLLRLLSKGYRQPARLDPHHCDARPEKGRHDDQKRITVSSKSEKEAWRKLREKITASDKGIPVAAEAWTVERFFRYGLDNVVRIKRPKTYQGYEGITRRFIVPALGKRKLDRLTMQDVRAMLTRLQHACRCCRDGIDAARPADKQECCAIGECCEKPLSTRSVQYVHAVLRAGLQPSDRASELDWWVIGIPGSGVERSAVERGSHRSVGGPTSPLR